MKLNVRHCDSLPQCVPLSLFIVFSLFLLLQTTNMLQSNLSINEHEKLFYFPPPSDDPTQPAFHLQHAKQPSEKTIKLLSSLADIPISTPQILSDKKVGSVMYEKVWCCITSLILILV